MRLLTVAALLAMAGCSDYDLYVHDGADVFYQNPASEVDILLVVDDSGSMASYQQRLSDNFSEFISFFVDADVDYHIGVVTTDVFADDAGHIIGDVITPETVNASDVFRQNVQVGILGSGFEMGLEAARMALTEPRISTTNAGFLRDSASLSILFVSDEEDSSPLPVADYINTFMGIKGFRDREVFNASSLVVLSPANCQGDARLYSTRGDRYLDVSDQTSGVIGDICEQSFADIITELSLNVSRLQDTFYLSQDPAVETLEVSVNEELIPCDAGVWTYQRLVGDGTPRSVIVFDRGEMPPPNAQIAVRYNYGSGDPTLFCSGEGSSVADDTGADDTGGAR